MKRTLIYLTAAFLPALSAWADVTEEAIKALQSDATLEQKFEACRVLATKGDGRAVPVLAKWLDDEKLAHMARYALEPIADPSVDTALREALGRVTGARRLGVIHSLGVRGDAGGVGPLAAVLRSGNPSEVKAAARALARIAVPEVVNPLTQAPGAPKPRVAEALLSVARTLVTEGHTEQARNVLTHLERGTTYRKMRTGVFLVRLKTDPARLLEGLQGTDQDIRNAGLTHLRSGMDRSALLDFAKRLPTLRPTNRARVIGALADSGEDELAATFMASLGDDAPKVRVAAIKALGRVGHTESSARLCSFLQSSANPEEAAAARAALAGMQGPAVDRALIAQMKTGSASEKKAIFELLTGRRSAGAGDALLHEAAKDPSIHLAALKALSVLAEPDHLPQLVDHVVNAKSEKARRGAEQAVVATALRMDREEARSDAAITALEKTDDPEAKGGLIRVLGRIGNARALEAVQAASSDPALADPTVRALAAWPNARALDPLLERVTQSENPTHRILALQGAANLLKKGTVRQGKAINAYAILLKASDRPEDKKLLLAGLGAQKSREALDLAEPLVADPSVRAEAKAALKSIQKNLEQAGKWKPLFDGKSLTGWRQTGDAEFKVKDGCIVGTQTGGKGGDLWTEKTYDNFELRVTYRMEWPNNSGIWFRYDGKKGYQYDILKYKKPLAYSGSLYCHGKLFLTRNTDESLENKDGWNEARILAEGKNLTLWLNGHQVGKITDDTFSKGLIGIQVHGGNHFKNKKITVKRIDIRTK